MWCLPESNYSLDVITHILWSLQAKVHPESHFNLKFGKLNSSKRGVVRLLRKYSAELGLSSCRDLSDVRTGSPFLGSLFSGKEPVTLQKTSRGVLCRIINESMIDMECRVRCVRLSHWIFVPGNGNNERLALSRRGQVSGWNFKFTALSEQWNRMDLSIGAWLSVARKYW